MFEFTELTEQDLPFFNETRNEVREYLHNNQEFTLKQTQEWFKTLKDNEKYHIIWRQFPALFVNNNIIEYPDGNLLDKERIGYFRTKFYKMPGRGLEEKELNILEIGSDLCTMYQGKGYAYEAYIQFIGLMKIEKNIKLFQLFVLGDNIRAYNLYRKLGFVQDPDPWELFEIQRNGRLIPSIKMIKWV